MKNDLTHYQWISPLNYAGIQWKRSRILISNPGIIQLRRRYEWYQTLNLVNLRDSKY